MNAVDAHTHLDLPAFDEDRDEVVARARAAGVTGFVIAAADPADWDRVAALADALGAVHTLGIHPWWLADMDVATADRWLSALSERPTPHGLGETGLDHLRARTDEAQALQARVFGDHLALARERDVPVVLHCVRAYRPLLRQLEAEGLPSAGGMVHSWSGDPGLVRRAIRLGLHVSFGTALARSERLRDALAQTPLDHLLLETDCPDQPLTPGTRGEPAHLLEVARLAAAVLGIPVDAVLQATAHNARRLFPALAAG